MNKTIGNIHHNYNLHTKCIRYLPDTAVILVNILQYLLWGRGVRGVQYPPEGGPKKNWALESQT